MLGSGTTPQVLVDCSIIAIQSLRTTVPAFKGLYPVKLALQVYQNKLQDLRSFVLKLSRQLCREQNHSKALLVVAKRQGKALTLKLQGKETELEVAPALSCLVVSYERQPSYVIHVRCMILAVVCALFAALDLKR